MKRLNKKIAIITGAASGIGKAITQRFSSEGANVVIADYAKDKKFPAKTLLSLFSGLTSPFSVMLGLDPSIQVNNIAKQAWIPGRIFSCSD